MDLIAKLKFGFLFKYFPQHKAACSYFVVIPEIFQTARLQLRPTPTSSAFEAEANLNFQDKYSYSRTTNFNKQGIYLEVTIDDYFLNYSGLIRCVAFFLGHPVWCRIMGEILQDYENRQMPS